MTKRKYRFLDELTQEIRQIDARLEEINPIWLETWRLKKHKERLERKLRQFRYV